MGVISGAPSGAGMNELGRAQVSKAEYYQATESPEAGSNDAVIGGLPSWIRMTFVYLPLVVGATMAVSSIVFSAPPIIFGIGMILALVGIFVALIKG